MSMLGPKPGSMPPLERRNSLPSLSWIRLMVKGQRLEIYHTDANAGSGTTSMRRHLAHPGKKANFYLSSNGVLTSWVFISSVHCTCCHYNILSKVNK